MTPEKPSFWKKCSNCKNSIGFNTIYQACSVSTCNHARRGLYFCSVSCWSAHVPLLRHREAYALENTSPSIEEYMRTLALETETSQPARPTPIKENVMSDHQPKKVFVTGPVVKPATPANPVAGLNPNFTKDVLIVVSKLKNYIRERSEMNTSADVIDALSDQLRKLCDQAIEQARADGRKTVMARDF